MTAPIWPTLNALLNLAAALCLLGGYRAIKAGNKETHRRFMLAAFSCSTAFLVSYLGYHYQVGSVKFTGEGPIRAVYLAILLTHTVFAAFVAPLAITTLSRALRQRFDLHRKIARITLPIWLYVSATGVVVYLMLYQM